MKKWKSFSDWRLRTKLFFILALCLVVSMLLSVYNMFHISRAYDRELYGAPFNFLSLSVTEIGYKLDNVQQMTTDLGQDSQIQTYLSHNKDASRAFSSEYNALYYLVQDYYKKNRVNCVSNITLYTGNFTLRSNTSANVYVPDEVYKDLYEAALGRMAQRCASRIIPGTTACFLSKRSAASKTFAWIRWASRSCRWIWKNW